MAIIAYYRVSTKDQGESGLGLEGQEAAVKAYAARHGETIVREYREVESGKRNDRPVLMLALAHARRARATLVIAKLDRLARNVHFLSGLMESGVDFVACDNPTANRLTIHILAAVAEDEARRISERTRAALAVYKTGRHVARRIIKLHPEGVPSDLRLAREGKLGSSLPEVPVLTEEARAKGRAVSAANASRRAAEAYADIAPAIVAMQAEGRSLAAIAAALNAEGYRTRNDKPWNPVQVMRVAARHANLRSA